MSRISIKSLLNPVSKRPRSSSVDGSSAGPSKRPATEQRSEELLDVVVSNVQTAIKMAIACTSSIPIVSRVLPPLQALVEKIVEARANVREKRKVLGEIEDLAKSIQSIGNDVSSCANGMTGIVCAAGSNVTDSGTIEIIATLSDLTLSIKEKADRGPVERFLYSSQDSEFLDDVRAKITAFRHNLEIKDRNGVRAILTAMSKSTHDQTETLQEIQRSRRHQDDLAVLEKLRPANASYKSYLTEEKSRLQQGTRSNILRDLTEWTTSNYPAHRVCVLHGPAGMGKSSIAHALCKQFASTHLGASFFFVRGSISDAHSFFPALACQIANAIPELFDPIVCAARGHLRDGQAQMLEHQMSDLLEVPLQMLAATSPRPTLLVVDGVDECSDSPSGIVEEMLQLLCGLASKVPFLRVLIATRPESYIMGALRYSDHTNVITFRDLQQEPDADDDICLFIRTEFEKASARGDFRLIIERPNAIDQLTRLSDGLFIFASTAVGFLIYHKYRAIVLLDTLLASQGSNTPRGLLGRLDTLYTDILRIAFDEFVSDQEHIRHIKAVFTWIVLQNEQEENVSATDLTFVGIPAGITMDIVHRLRSVLIVDDSITPATRILACHASFPQFLSDSARCTDPAFLVDPPSGHAMIATSLLDLLARNDVDSLRDADGDMPEMWMYARMRWDEHLCDARYTPKLGRALRGFVETHLEDWLQNKDPWGCGGPVVTLVDYCADVRTWYKQNGPDDGLAAALNTIVDRRVKEIVVKAAQSPDEFKSRSLGDEGLHVIRTLG